MKKFIRGIGCTLLIFAVIIFFITAKKEDIPQNTKSNDNRPPEIKYPRAYRMTHLHKPDNSDEVLVRKGKWLPKPVYIEAQKWLWVEFLNKNIPDDRAYIRCSSWPEKIEEAKVTLKQLNTAEQAFPDETLCRYFDIMLPPDSKMSSATVLFLSTQMR